VRALRQAGFEVRVTRSRAALMRVPAPLPDVPDGLDGFDLVIAPPEVVAAAQRPPALEALLPFAQVLISEASLGTLSATLLEQLRRETGAAVAWLALEHEPAVLELSGQATVSPRELLRLAAWLLRVRPAKAGAGTLDMPAIVARLAREGDESLAAALAGTGWHRLLVVPLMVRGRRTGLVAAAGGGEPLHTDRVTLRYLEILAAQVAIAIENTWLYHHTRAQSLTDPLTGLPNARFLHEHLPVMLAQAERSRRPLSLILLDSDSSETSSGLKRVNDLHGHDIGDRLIIQLAEAIRGRYHGHDAAGERPEEAEARRGALGRGVRSSDVLVRYGGDEFVVLMPDTSTAQALRVAERLRHEVASQVFSIDSAAVHCTISLGIATFPDDARNADGLLRCADEAMYAAKRAGKNTIRAYAQLGRPPEPACQPVPVEWPAAPLDARPAT